MMFSADPDLDDLRAVMRQLMSTCEGSTEAADVARIREIHRMACTQVGLAGLAESEAYGGTDAGLPALTVALEEAGRSLTPLPVLTSVLISQTALKHTTRSDVHARILAEAVNGEKILALVGQDEDGPMSAESAGDQWRITGRHSVALGADSAHLLLVIAQSTDGPALFVVDTDSPGVEITPVESMDITRTGSIVRLADAVGELVGEIADLMSFTAHLRNRLAIGLAAEQTGAAQRVLELTVEYLSTRVQFGRVIGSFQSLKHACAELAVDIDEARSALAHGIWASEAKDSASITPEVAMAASVCIGAGVKTAEESIQLHGGVGFTWEHPAHLYLRRALTSQAIVGSQTDLLEAVLQGEGI